MKFDYLSVRPYILYKRIPQIEIIIVLIRAIKYKYT